MMTYLFADIFFDDSCCGITDGSEYEISAPCETRSCSNGVLQSPFRALHDGGWRDIGLGAEQELPRSAFRCRVFEDSNVIWF